MKAIWTKRGARYALGVCRRCGKRGKVYVHPSTGRVLPCAPCRAAMNRAAKARAR